MLQRIVGLPVHLRCGVEFLGLDLKGEADRFELIGQFEACDAPR